MTLRGRTAALPGPRALVGGLLVLVLLAAGVRLAGGVVRPGKARAAAVDTLHLLPWRFPVGERMEFSVTFGTVRVGKGLLEVEAIDTVAARPAYRLAFSLQGGPFFYRVDDRQVSWMQPAPPRSLRFDQRLRQGSYERDRRYLFDPEENLYTRFDLREARWVPHPEEADVPVPPAALDEVSFLYFVRMLPLDVGTRYEFDRHFEEKGNPVILEVLRRERVRVPAGWFDAVVVRPVIRAGGLFAEEGRAEVWLSDDDRRIVLQLRSRMKAGSMNMYLREYDPGAGGVLIEPPAEPPGDELPEEGPEVADEEASDAAPDGAP